MKTIVKAPNLSYKINEKKLFHSISFDGCAGSALYVAGGNGSGKTTLLRMVLGISKPTMGSI